jgi:L-lactate dehydrogenase complex protein LldF
VGRELTDRIRKAVRDPVLAANVIRATDTSLAHRRETVAERADWEDLRDRAAALKDHTLRHLDRYLVEFTENARARGATVHVARDAREACRIITELARRKGATRILKSKSMTTEEVGLNQAFAARGFTPLETDLGEYIVQLADEPPSHITAPALHCSAEQIRDLFAREGVTDGIDTPPEDRKELARWLSLAARRHLRPRLLEADLGITGANFLIAETGTVALVENEGNIRLTTTSAPVTVSLAGIEKLLPKMTDLATMLPLLTRSATGQRMTAYFSLLSGGAGEQHVVLLDNGRVDALATAADREILRCIRCGACLNICPVYRTVGGHAYGWTYPGPIGSLLSPMLRGRGEDHDLPFLSSLCGACTEICPVKIRIHEHLLRMRGEAVRENRRPLRERLAFAAFRLVMRHPALYRQLAAATRRLLPPAARGGLLAPWTKYRELPIPTPRTFKEIWREDGPPAP